MIEYEFNTEDLPASDRFDRAREQVFHLPSPHDASTDDATAFRMHRRELHLDDLRLWTMAVQPVTLHRTASLVRRSDPETYNIILLQHGSVGRTWGPYEATYGPGDLHAADSSQPYELRVRSHQGLIRWQGVTIPKKLLPPRTDRLVGRRIPAREGIGALLSGFLTRLTTDSGAYLPSDGPRLRAVLLDLASALLAHEIEADHTLAAQTGRHGLTLRIRTFIQQHLGDPHMAPGTVAAAHHISTSYLYLRSAAV